MVAAAPDGGADGRPQRVGKTTTAAKLARWLAGKGRKPLLVACDLQRPAAVKQLQVLGEQVKVPVFAPHPGAGRRPRCRSPSAPATGPSGPGGT